MRNLQFLIWPGAALTLAGLAGIVWCIIAARGVRRGGLDEGAQRARLQQIVSVNMGALAASMLGLILVALGVFLGR